jgi:hypothetical protein
MDSKSRLKPGKNGAVAFACSNLGALNGAAKEQPGRLFHIFLNQSEAYQNISVTL